MLPIVEAIRNRTDKPISIDTYFPEVADAALAEEKFEILKYPEGFRYKEYPLLYGVSRKRTIAALTNESDPLARDFGSVTASLFAANKGVEIVRVHHVKGIRDALNVWAILNSKE
ncbi:dihydropteroate synthase [Enterococcus crotali]|uniref:dihydropteroate synthase n=1 Tax=Enterococcus crotali TaxID=1453587 RepID=UPI0023BAE40E|nr:dihydropteroate synthase [Enterococcus crotali]